MLEQTQTYESKNLRYVLMALPAVTCVMAGGYFEYVSCFSGIILLFVLGYLVFRKKEWKLTIDGNLLSVLVVVSMYLLTCLWAVDRGMAFYGFLKFLPLLVWTVLLRQLSIDRERMVQMVPVFAVLMTVYSCILMQFHTFRSYVSVAGRLAGFFQYPNTYAVFLLMACIIVSYRRDWAAVIYTLILLFGIYKSGSLTVYILTGVTAVIFLFIHKDIRKYLLILYGVVLAAGIIYVISSGMLVDLELKSSTFLGRLLYCQDVLPVILKHPFGVGYYGYYFLEPEIQTGVYSVLNVHNEFLQMAIDIGILPACFFFVTYLHNIWKREQSSRNRLVLGVLFFHAMLDYDFQFLGILFLLPLFWTPGNEEMSSKQEKIKWQKEVCIQTSIFSKVSGAILLLAGVAVSIFYGLSSWQYVQGNYASAYQLCRGNTMAELRYMEACEDVGEAKALADDILLRNSHISFTHDILAAYAYSSGDMEGYIREKSAALSMYPYNYAGYIDYMNTLAQAATVYIQAGDQESAGVCVKRMRSVYDILEKVEEQTSDLAWKIQDVPQVTLPPEYDSLILELEERIYE